eukprot:5658166-Alexandrium_andersonii.AAC.1
MLVKLPPDCAPPPELPYRFLLVLGPLKVVLHTDLQELRGRDGTLPWLLDRLLVLFDARTNDAFPAEDEDDDGS